MKQYAFTAAQLGLTVPVVVAAAANADLTLADFLQQCFGSVLTTRSGKTAPFSALKQINAVYTFTATALGIMTVGVTSKLGGVTYQSKGAAFGAFAGSDYQLVMAYNPNTAQGTLTFNVYLITAGVRSNTVFATLALTNMMSCDDFRANVAMATQGISIGAAGASVVMED